MAQIHDPDRGPGTSTGTGTGTPGPVSVRGVTDPARAEALVGDAYLPNRLEVSPRASRLDMSLTVLPVGQLTVGLLGYGQEVRVVTDDASNFHVDVPVAGRAEMSAGRDSVVAAPWDEGAVFSPGEPARMRWSDSCLQVCLMIPPGILETQLEELVGRSMVRPLRFDFAMDLRGSIGRSCSDTLRLLARELGDGPGLLLHPYTASHVQSLLLDGLLLGQPHNYLEDVEGPARPGTTAIIARVVDLINERANEPWSSTTLAREAHLSVRALQEGFKRDVGQPPMRYLRDVRLRRVHAVLRDARPGSTTVQAVASRWGMLHMGRLAAAYRAAFGEPPSSTLAR
ncbi:AraC family transcriptional regulator [Nocardioides aquiterrae]|uniref:HTH araC/xylS-type domain-containing protein n=1 Tax=Nocardioides aquiterrae TaxID=203799 RepID=A0ABP4F5B7_9ACTN